MKLQRVEIIGAGPAGLYTAILLKRSMPDAHVIVREQNPRNATFGFGVVFSDQALGFLNADDPETHELITPHMERWQNMTLNLAGETVVIDGIGFSALGRLQLLSILQSRAEQAGVELVYNQPVRTLDDLAADLIVGADGFNSIVRRSDPEKFKTSLAYFANYFAWFGCRNPFPTLTQTFVNTEHGAMNAHHYRYSQNMSTFIVECEPAAYQSLGFHQLNETESAIVCKQIFSDALQGVPLVVNRSIWRQFPKLWCDRWYFENQVLLGDAAHTAHFSIGSGTRLALEDAIALVKALNSSHSLYSALRTYQESRQPIAKKIIEAATKSGNWYDRFADHMKLSAIDFAFSYLTRSHRVNLGRLRKNSPQFMKTYDSYKAA